MVKKEIPHITISKELHLEVHSKHRLLGFKSMKAFLEQAIKDALQKHSTPANNGNLNSSLDEACKQEIQD